MKALRSLSPLSLALRWLVLAALMAIAPLYETAHGMVRAGGTVVALAADEMPAPDMPAQDMPAQEMAVGHMAFGDMPDRQGAQDIGCLILCFGWVETPVAERQDGQTSEIGLVLLPDGASLLDGIAPAPNRHPPKPLRFV